MTDIFISYAREDLSRVAPLAKSLESLGLSVWWDPQIPVGATWRQVIDEALKDAKCVVVVWSNVSTDKRWVIEEADFGLENKIYVPVLIDDTKPPIGFMQIQAARLIDWQGDTKHAQYRKLLKAMEDVIGVSLPSVEASQTNDSEANTNGRTQARQRSLATWIFGSCLFIFLIAAFVFAPASLPEFKHRLLALMSALLAAFFGYFLTGNINVEIAKESKIGQLAVKATGGVALFALVLWWWMSPLAPIAERIDAPAKPYEQVLSGSIRGESGIPLSGVNISLPAFGKATVTDNLGRFEIKVEARHQTTVELMAQKYGYQPHEQYATLGNTAMSFTMKEAK